MLSKQDILDMYKKIYGTKNVMGRHSTTEIIDQNNASVLYFCCVSVKNQELHFSCITKLFLDIKVAT
jgi:hypothetical protein